MHVKLELKQQTNYNRNLKKKQDSGYPKTNSYTKIYM